MRRLLALAAVLLAFAVSTPAQESIHLAVPVVRSTTDCSLRYLGLDVGNARIVVELACNDGSTIQKVYDATTTPTGAALLTTVNRLDNSSVSFIAHIYQRLIADGVVTGTITGAPQEEE